MNSKIRGSLIKIWKSGCLQEGVNLFDFFFSEEDKKEYIRIEYSSPEGETSTMVVIKWSENVEGYGENIYSPLCGGLYKEEED